VCRLQSCQFRQVLVSFLKCINLIDIAVDQIEFHSIVKTRIGDFESLAGFFQGIPQGYGGVIFFCRIVRSNALAEICFHGTFFLSAEF